MAYKIPPESQDVPAPHMDGPVRERDWSPEPGVWTHLHAILVSLASTLPLYLGGVIAYDGLFGVAAPNWWSIAAGTVIVAAGVAVLAAALLSLQGVRRAPYVSGVVGIGMIAVGPVLATDVTVLGGLVLAAGVVTVVVAWAAIMDLDPLK